MSLVLPKLFVFGYRNGVEKKQTFVDNIGTTNIRTSEEINFQKQRIEMLSHMSALEVAEAPFVCNCI